MFSNRIVDKWTSLSDTRHMLLRTISLFLHLKYVNHTCTNIRYHFLLVVFVKVWISLPADIVDFSTLCRFRRSLRNIDFSEFLIVQ